MSWKRKLLNDSKLYLILDTEIVGYNELYQIAKQAIAGGIDLIQLRDKQGLAKDILTFSKKIKALLKNKVPYILNDRVDLALAAGADGVHLGQEDLPVSLARKILGPTRVIGISCQTLQQAKAAQKSRADYIGLGSVFKTQTKPERQPMDQGLLRRVNQEIRLPVFAIGGIDQKNLRQLTQSGIRRVAVCRAVCQASDVKQAVARLKKILEDMRNLRG